MSVMGIVGIVLGAVVLFSVAPSAVSLICIFARNNMSDRAFDRPYFEPYRDRMTEATAFFDRLDLMPVEISAPDGTKLAGEYLDGGFSRTAILAHGYRATPMSNFCVHGRLFYEHGYNLLFIDQRAHGRSGGRYTTLGVKEGGDLLAWIGWAERNLKDQTLLVYGMSMGAYALALASDRIQSDRVRVLVCDCGYVSFERQLINDSVQRHLPLPLMLPWIRLFAKWFYGIDVQASAADSLSRCRIPVFFLHGEADSAVPCDHARECFAACAADKQLLTVPGAEHTMSLIVGGAAAEKTLFSFIEKYTSTEEKESKL